MSASVPFWRSAGLSLLILAIFLGAWEITVMPKAGGGGAARALRAQQRAAGAEPHGDQPAAGSDGCRGRLHSAPVPLPGKKLILTNI